MKRTSLFSFGPTLFIGLAVLTSSQVFTDLRGQVTRSGIDFSGLSSSADNNTRRTMDEHQRAVVEECLGELEAEAASYEKMAQADKDSNTRSGWVEEAAALRSLVSRARSSTFAFGPHADSEKSDAAYVVGSKVVYLTPKFFRDISEMDDAKLDSRRQQIAEAKASGRQAWAVSLEKALATEMKAAEQKAIASREARRQARKGIMLHELVHLQQGFLTRKTSLTSTIEKEAYFLEYSYLRLRGADLTTVISQIKENGFCSASDAEGIKRELDAALRIENKLALKGMVEAGRRPPGPSAEEAVTPPSGEFASLPKKPLVKQGMDRQWGLDVVAKWKKDSIAQLQRMMEEDPEREANKKACLALWGTDYTAPCPKCGNTVKWWWIENSWCSPCCEVWVYPINRLRPDGKTYTDFASERKKIYEDKIREIEQQAAAMERDLG